MDVKTPKIKHSSLSFTNAIGRILTDQDNKEGMYNDFTNEGHMYPVHGVGDLDKTKDLLGKMKQSFQGDPFEVEDLGISVQVAEPYGKNAFFDFHTIPTKILDGSTRLPSGHRIENALPYFTKQDEIPEDLKEFTLNFSTGEATVPDSYKTKYPDAHLPDTVPTTLFSTRATPFLEQDEDLGLLFFSDGPQARVNNGAKVTNWRFVCPAYALDMVWFVAKAWKPVAHGTHGATEIETTTGVKQWVVPRKANETNDLSMIAYNQSRYMECVTEPIRIKNGYARQSAFSQRYPDKSMNFGDVILKDNYDEDTTTGHIVSNEEIMIACKSIFAKFVTNTKFPDKQIAYNLMLNKALKMFRELHKGFVPSEEHMMWDQFRTIFINTTTYNISAPALAIKARERKSYMPVNVGETGWLVVDLEDSLDVPSGDGEYFIGWGMSSQPPDRLDPQYVEGFSFAQAQGWAMHQGPGMLFMTGGDEPHIGTQEPIILKHNYPLQQRSDETPDAFALRVKQSLPNVHWRLDEPRVIRAGLRKGAITETNVGAAQLMLQSVGSLTKIGTPSRSPNFLAQLQSLGLQGKELADYLGPHKQIPERFSVDQKKILEEYHNNPDKIGNTYVYHGVMDSIGSVSMNDQSRNENTYHHW
jgi:hypothetical protein